MLVTCFNTRRLGGKIRFKKCARIGVIKLLAQPDHASLALDEGFDLKPGSDALAFLVPHDRRHSGVDISDDEKPKRSGCVRAR